MAASSPTFGPQWPRTNPNIVTLVRKDGLRIPIHRELAPLVAMLMDLTEALGYDLVPGWCWGYANRPIAGTNIPSNHSRGCAVDLNAPKNPYASKAWHRRNATAYPFGLPRRTDIPQWVFNLWEQHGFDLGVKYEAFPDPMHFEFTQTVAECHVITERLRRRLTPTPNPPKPPTPKPPTEEDEMQFRILWYRGEPSATGDQPDVTAAYKVMETKDSITKKIVGVNATWINGQANLDFLRFIGIEEPTGDELGSSANPLQLADWRAGLAFLNGPFKNT